MHNANPAPTTKPRRTRTPNTIIHVYEPDERVQLEVLRKLLEDKFPQFKAVVR